MNQTPNGFYMLMIATFAGLFSLSAALVFFTQRNRARKKVEELSEAKETADIELVRVKTKIKKRIQSEVGAQIAELQTKFDQDNTHLLSQAYVGETMTQLSKSIRDSVEKKFNRTSQEFVGVLTDEAEGMIRELHIELCEKIWDAFQAFKTMSKETPCVLPEGCKLAYTKNQRSVIVIEQKPQVRTVSFTAKLVKLKKVASEAKCKKNGGYRYNLAFPYVYFVVVFDHGRYAYHETYFRNKPLTSVREHIYLAPIPNVYRDVGDNHKPMCMGEDFDESVVQENTVARQCDAVIADFWQSVFSADLGDGEPEEIDARIADYAAWQENTETDPLFILTVPWTQGKTMKGTVECILDQRVHQQNSLDMVDNTIRLRLEQGVASLTKRINEEVQRAKASGLSLYDLDQLAESLLEETVLGHSKRVFEQCIK
jgi:hypothetical protein